MGRSRLTDPQREALLRAANAGPGHVSCNRRFRAYESLAKMGLGRYEKKQHPGGAWTTFFLINDSGRERAAQEARP